MNRKYGFEEQKQMDILTSGMPFNVIDILEGMIAAGIVAGIAFWLFNRRRKKFNEHLVQMVYELKHIEYQLLSQDVEAKDPDRYRELQSHLSDKIAELIIIVGKIKYIEQK